MTKTNFVLLFVIMALSTIMGCEDELIEKGNIPIGKPSGISVDGVQTTSARLTITHPEITGGGSYTAGYFALEVEINGIVKEYALSMAYDYLHSYITLSELTTGTTYSSWRVRYKAWGRTGEWVEGPAFTTGNIIYNPLPMKIIVTFGNEKWESAQNNYNYHRLIAYKNSSTVSEYPRFYMQGDFFSNQSTTLDNTTILPNYRNVTNRFEYYDGENTGWYYTNDPNTKYGKWVLLNGQVNVTSRQSGQTSGVAQGTMFDFMERYGSGTENPNYAKKSIRVEFYNLDDQYFKALTKAMTANQPVIHPQGVPVSVSEQKAIK
jgi:hypothetical protein